MKKIADLDTATLAQLLEKSGISVEEAKPTPAKPTWRDGTPRRAADLYDEERALHDQQYFEEVRASGLLARVRAEAEADAAAEREAIQRAEHEAALVAKIAQLDERDRLQQAARDEAEFRRTQGITLPMRDGKPLT